MKIKSANDTKYDIVSLGEVMLRLDPGEGRIRTTRLFNVYAVSYTHLTLPTIYSV